MTGKGPHISSLTEIDQMKPGFNDSAIYWDIVNTGKNRGAAELSSALEIVIHENGIL